MADNGEWYDGLNGEYALSPQLANRRAMYCKSAATGTRVAIWWYEWTNTRGADTMSRVHLPITILSNYDTFKILNIISHHVHGCT
jgi:hypothetical protein